MHEDADPAGDTGVQQDLGTADVHCFHVLRAQIAPIDDDGAVDDGIDPLERAPERDRIEDVTANGRDAGRFDEVVGDELDAVRERDAAGGELANQGLAEKARPTGDEHPADVSRAVHPSSEGTGGIRASG